MPKIFNSFTHLNKLTSLDEILNLPLRLKIVGNMFYGDHVSTYPFDKDIALQELELLAEKNERILIYENFFFWFSEYFPLYTNTITKLMKDEGVIPIHWRYYIAIMVHIYFINIK
jgi:hypothetical protein